MKYFIWLFLFFQSSFIHAQYVQKYSAGSIKQQLLSFRNNGRVMYLAAHPDDENTRLISYLTNYLHLETVYLSLTRGDGGQNLIGTELGSTLGVLRTHELLQARAVDGGKQLFTRANDFGFSKHPDETMRIWNEAEVLKDMVLAIRQFQPHVIINRFSTKNPGETHGHHSASAILAEKAVKLASDPNYKISGTTNQTWQISQMYCNVSRFFFKTQEEFDQMAKSGLYQVDCGVYLPLLGYSNNEIASLSRSKHRCQGFGSALSRGNVIEYLELLEGSRPPSLTEPFAELGESWDLISGKAGLSTLVNTLVNNFSFENPERSLPLLLRIHSELKSAPASAWKQNKLTALNEIILSCLGVYSEFVSDRQSYVPGDSVLINVEWVARLTDQVRINSVRIHNQTFEINKSLGTNESYRTNFKIGLSPSAPLTSPYWLQGEYAPALYSVSDPDLIGQPENPPAISVEVVYEINNQILTVSNLATFKSVDPAFGEKYDIIQIVPPVSGYFLQPAIPAISGKQTIVDFEVISSVGAASVQVKPALPKGWSSQPTSIPMDFKFRNEKKSASFNIQGPDFDGIDSVGLDIIYNGKPYKRGYKIIQYDHVPGRIINISNRIPFSVIPDNTHAGKIGYITGAGDLVANSLKYAGYQITKIEPSDFNLNYFTQFKTIVLGIRIFNVNEDSEVLNDLLNKYVERGGKVIAQYNTDRGLKTKQVGPYPIELARTRVTDEYAEVGILDSGHPLVNKPNKITQNDFKNWVQERGLYFVNKYDPAYKAILTMHDPGEPPSDGSLIVANYGKGKYIFTSLSFFRQLPAGIPGAYKLFENLLAY